MGGVRRRRVLPWRWLETRRCGEGAGSRSCVMGELSPSVLQVMRWTDRSD